ncbi:uncharacterized protein LOC111319673 [Stylophora pistillata]|uniref:uncharacterized protein LOC111319673 n=1 Tax=Stylophora pistillata TaxID=50429 RepID=UPI000C053F95|nr:uncharacterized protein LOC111319673 [Stylophora pistillata]
MVTWPMGLCYPCSAVNLFRVNSVTEGKLKLFCNFLPTPKINTMFGQDKLFRENIEVKEKQGDTTNAQFAFPKQCLVLGDPRVGKTSLVNALTGKPFDPAEQTTQGIDQSLVDHEWKNCDMKDLVFGDLWRYLKTGDVEVTLIGSGGRNNKDHYDYPSVQLNRPGIESL